MVDDTFPWNAVTLLNCIWITDEHLTSWINTATPKIQASNCETLFMLQLALIVYNKTKRLCC